MDEEGKLTWGRDMPGELMDKWPKGPEGQPVTPALLTSCAQQDMSDVLLMSLLDSCGIPSLRKFPHYGGFGSLMLGMSAEGVDIFVPETMLDDARAIMEGAPENEEQL